jgi:fatty acid desaturase
MASRSRPTRSAALELPTLALVVAVHAGWLALTYHHRHVPIWLLAPLGALLICLHGSLQHEIIHGHPTRWSRLNTLMASLPLSLWLPFALYRDSHLAHHRTAWLTDPLDDPESFYVETEAWQRAGRLRRALLWAHATLLGRLLLGPPRMIMTFWASCARALGRGDRRNASAWAWHLVAVAAVLGWLVVVCELPLGIYVVCIVYPGLALTLVRSFVEHRPSPDPGGRTLVVESRGPFALLFLNNNLHVLHHEMPRLPWYRLPASYRARADELRARGLVLSGYGEVFRRFLLRPRETPCYPGRTPEKAPARRTASAA